MKDTWAGEDQPLELGMLKSEGQRVFTSRWGLTLNSRVGWCTAAGMGEDVPSWYHYGSAWPGIR